MAFNSKFSISNFKDALRFDGARPNLFQIQIQFPTALQLADTGLTQDLTFMAKAGQLPGSTVSSITIPYQGREVKVAGNRTFPDWTVTIINDEDFRFRNGFEKWLNYINAHEANIRGNASFTTTPTNYFCDMIVYQLNKTGSATKTYTFKDAFPIDVSPIDLDWGNNDVLEEFSVTFAYQYWMSTLPTGVTT